MKGDILYELALFAGGGGGILAGMLLGRTCIGACEIEEYQRRVLLARQKDGLLPEFPIWDDIRTFRSDNAECAEFFDYLRTIRNGLSITAGFPCQDISAAGKGAGISGERSGLWGEARRIIDEVRPAYAELENSPMLVSRGLAVVISDLCKMGYDCRWGVLGADDFGAPHRRKRIWISAALGDAERKRLERHTRNETRSQRRSFKSRPASASSLCADVADTANQRNVRRHRKLSADAAAGCVGRSDGTREEIYDGWEWWNAEPDFPRVANDVAYRVDRIETIGNGQVPIVAATAWELLK
ncbi:MAG: DNA cytosine methyltransferase [Kiritimatiellales bacterium]